MRVSSTFPASRMSRRYTQWGYTQITSPKLLWTILHSLAVSNYKEWIKSKRYLCQSCLKQMIFWFKWSIRQASVFLSSPYLEHWTCKAISLGIIITLFQYAKTFNKIINSMDFSSLSSSDITTSDVAGNILFPALKWAHSLTFTGDFSR